MAQANCSGGSNHVRWFAPAQGGRWCTALWGVGPHIGNSAAIVSDHTGMVLDVLNRSQARAAPVVVSGMGNGREPATDHCAFRAADGPSMTTRPYGSTWPTTITPHLLINRRTGPRTNRVRRGFPWLKLGVTPQALREDRILQEIHATGDGLRRICDLFVPAVSGAMGCTAGLDGCAGGHGGAVRQYGGRVMRRALLDRATVVEGVASAGV